MTRFVAGARDYGNEKEFAPGAPFAVVRGEGPDRARGRGAPRLMDRVRGVMRFRHYSRRTEEAYTGWIRRYILFHGKRHPEALGTEEVRAFLTDLAVNGKVAAPTQNQALSALLFLYQQVLQRPIAWLEDVPRAQRPAKLPVVCTVAEVQALLGAIKPGGVRMMAQLLSSLRSCTSQCRCGEVQLRGLVRSQVQL